MGRNANNGTGRDGGCQIRAAATVQTNAGTTGQEIEMKTKIINVQAPNGIQDQSPRYIEVLQVSCAGQTHKLRITIRDDSIPRQKSATISRWDGSKWHLVHSLLPAEMKTSASYSRTCSAANFKADRDALLDVATQILA